MSLDTLQLLAPFAVISLLLGFFIYFVAQYIWPSYGLESALKRINIGLGSLKSTPFGSRKRQVGELFKGSMLEHIWGEFEQTLHDQFHEKDGELELYNSRGTVPAGYFFTAASVADRTLKTEYFKHLPGIMTGIGIIGTFAGLLFGLSAFDASNTEKINESIDLLLSGVMEAFIASAAAITAAMIVTHWEKLRYRKCLNELDTLNESIDALFDAGVGEEYLSQLVKSAEESSKQTRLLKDSLVTDLKEMLLNLVEANARESADLRTALIESNRESSQKIADQIGESIATNLQGPLNKLAETAMASAGDQSGKVQNLLQDALVAFMDRLDHTFGQQFAGLSDMLKSSTAVIGQMESQMAQLIEAMQRSAEESSKAASDRLTQMMVDMEQRNEHFGRQVQDMLAAFNDTISNMGSAGKNANDEMATMMRKMFDDAAEQQLAMKGSLDAFIRSLTDQVGQGHQKTVDKISEALGSLSTQMEGVFGVFKDSQSALEAQRKQEQQDLHGQSRAALEQMENQLAGLLSAIREQNTGVKDALDKLQEGTTAMISGLTSGAEKIGGAATRFELAGNAVSVSTEKSANLITLVNKTSEHLGGASTKLAGLIEDYSATRELVQKVITGAERVAAALQSDAAARQQMTQDLSSVAERLGGITNEMKTYLRDFNGVVTTSFGSFTDGMNGSLSKVMSSLDNELDRAVKALGSGVAELAEVVEELSEVRIK